jgi:iron complex outermembrane receptor protein
MTAVCAAFLAGGPAAAQDYRDTVVVTAATVPVDLGSVTRAVTVITREQIAALPVQSVADVLRLAASVDVRARGDHGVQTDFSIRGASFGQMLVLVDGVRLNDAQSGHHNGDIPVPLDAVERIEILYGPGSSLFGADAFGGTINVITRGAAARPSLVVQGGSFGYAGGRGTAGVRSGSLTESVAVAADRSSGFMPDRDFNTTTIQSRTAIGERSHVDAAFVRKEFGANNFYGGDAPSREWTNQTLLSADELLGTAAGWKLRAVESYRTHGDHFIFNELNPALSDNQHRTHEVLGSVRGSRELPDKGSVTVGVEGGGNWIRSTNLGNHDQQRISGFGEWRQGFAGRGQVDAGLRVDRYTEFGASWSPSAGVGWWPSEHVKLKASGGRAFRVPSFTERFYSDPANLARPEVGPETSWSAEGGAEIYLSSAWMLQANTFSRWDSNVIDWLRPSTAVRWQTYNVRDVDTQGIELGARKSFGRDFVHAEYTFIDLNAAAVDQLSKYLLDYAPHSLIADASVALPGHLRLAPRMEYRRRTRSSGTSQYVLLDLRVARPIVGGLDLYVDGSNLLDQTYQEVSGVAMPGAAFTVSVALHSR